jgi:hypothetical protein
MSRMIKILAAVALVAAAPAMASAANIVISPRYGQAYNAAFEPIGTPEVVPAGGYVQIDVRMLFLNAAAGEDFSSVGFNIGVQHAMGSSGPLPVAQILSGSSPWMSPASASGNLNVGNAPYTTYPNPSPALQSYANYDANGGSPGGSTPHFSQNTDGGVAGDLLAILVAAGNVEANNRQYGEASRPGAGHPDQLGNATLIGSILYQVGAGIDLAHQYTFTITPVDGVPWSSWINNAAGAGTTSNGTAQSFLGEGLTLPGPEPTSMVMMGFAGLGLALVARRRKV